MAHYTRIGGTNYEITGGKTRIGGTNYSISGGRTRVGGTNYDISFQNEIVITITGDEGEVPYCYITINGINYTTGEITIEKNVSIVLHCYAGRNFGGTITLNGELLYKVPSAGVGSYNYVPNANCKNVNIEFSILRAPFGGILSSDIIIIEN